MGNAFEPNAKTIKLCEGYYKYEIFGKAVVDYETAVFCELCNLVSKNHAIAKAIEERKLTISTLADELEALNIELFGLALNDYIYKFVEEKTDKSSYSDFDSLTEIGFSKVFLSSGTTSKLWEVAGFYNNIIGEAAVEQEVSYNWSVPKDRLGYYLSHGKDYEAYKAQKEETHNNEWNVEFERTKTLLGDIECCTRYTNRLCSSGIWNESVIIQHRLATALATRLGVTPNIEMVFLLQKIIVGLYNNAEYHIECVESYGSWENARKSDDEFQSQLLSKMKKWAENIRKQEPENTHKDSGAL